MPTGGITLKINWSNDHDPTTGYGRVASSMRKAFMELGHEISDEGIKIFHGLPIKTTFGADYIYTMFETAPAPLGWGVVMDSAKKVFTGSTWSQNCLKGATRRVQIIPVGHGVDINPIPRKERSDGMFKFLTCAENVPRKFIKELITAFEEEFKDDERVQLNVKTWATPINPVGLFYGTKRTLFLHSKVNDMARLYANHDAYVLPSLEGWGLTQMEAIACGFKPIVLGFGGVMDFCDEENSIMVKPTPPQQCPISNFPFMESYMKWVKPDIKDLKEKMRDVYEKGGEYLSKEYSDAFIKKWTWKDVARKIIDELD